MKFFSSLLVAFALAGAPIAAQAQAGQATPAAKQRVVIQVSDPDPRIWAQSMNYTENLQNIYGKDNVEVEVVALGPVGQPLTVEMVVVPVKPVRAFSSDWPVLRPVRVVGAGTLLLALWARFSSSASLAVNSPRRAAAAGASTSRISTRPRI